MSYAVAWLALAFVQNGDHAGEAQPALPADLAVPEAIVRSAADELATFTFPDDVTVELVASEPLIRDPVAFAFDAQGALWVAEMTGYMPDVDGKGEREPVGSIAILRDRDGDGRFETRTTFLDHLVLPRAVRPCRGGALVLAPPELLFCVDEDGDDVCDDWRVVDRGLEGLSSPEWAINALVPTLDNAFDCAKSPWRYVFRDGEFVREPRAQAGQWGATQDDQGRLFTNNNSDALRVDLVSATYGARNPHLDALDGVDVRVVDDQSVRSARINPGVNRGYQKGILDGSFHLANVTGACSPWIARGDGIPERLLGDAFVAEPCGNVVIDYDLVETSDGSVHGAPVRFGERSLDFLASTDERFRPVALGDGPDGALYVVDMYRGLIQHRLFVTSFLREQVVARKLDRPTGLGRIWRVVAKKRPVAKAPLANADDRALVAALSDANGWRRDTAQRLIVEYFDARSPAIAELERVVRSGERWFARVHAMWALVGVGSLSADVALAALRDADERVRVQAVRASESLAPTNASIPTSWRALAARDSFRVRRQVLLSFGVLGSAADEALAESAERGLATAAERSALVSSLHGRELEFLGRVLAFPPRTDRAGERELVQLLARCVGNEFAAERVERAFSLAASLAPERAAVAEALVRGLASAAPPDPSGANGPFVLAREPAGWSRLVTRLVARASDEWKTLDALVVWPGNPGVTLTTSRELDAAERTRFERGRELFTATCSACHGERGDGQPNVVPPLRASPFVLGDDARLIRLVTHGLVGPVEVRGRRFDGEMPGLTTTDADLAAILTYVRRAWNHGADSISVERVREVRAMNVDRRRPWTLDELNAQR